MLGSRAKLIGVVANTTVGDRIPESHKSDTYIETPLNPKTDLTDKDIQNFKIKYVFSEWSELLLTIVFDTIPKGSNEPDPNKKSEAFDLLYNKIVDCDPTDSEWIDEELKNTNYQ